MSPHRVSCVGLTDSEPRTPAVSQFCSGTFPAAQGAGHVFRAEPCFLSSGLRPGLLLGRRLTGSQSINQESCTLLFAPPKAARAGERALLGRPKGGLAMAPEPGQALALLATRSGDARRGRATPPTSGLPGPRETSAVLAFDCLQGLSKRSFDCT